MPRIQLSSLDEFITSLSKLDYEAAKLASGRVMEDHIQMGALMFSLLTIEMMYTSMDYLTPSNFRRGNNYLLNMYDPLPRRLSKLLKKVMADYEEEHERLVLLGTRPGLTEPSAFGYPAHGDNSYLASHAQCSDAAGIPTHAMAAPNDGRGGFTDPNQIQALSRPHNSTSVLQPVDRSTGHKGHKYRQWPDDEHELRSGASTAEPFDPNQYLANMDEAEKVLQELETVKQLVDFISKFIEVRKTMVVLYRFVAVTGPVLYVRKLDIMLGHCKEMLQTIAPNELYKNLFDHVRNEVVLVSSLVNWNSHIALHNVVQSATSMKHTKALLRVWKDTLPSGKPTATTKQMQSPDKPNASHSLLYSAFAKSSRAVQNLLWGDSGRSPSISDSQGPTLGRKRGIVVWISCWTDFLVFKTTAYFQQIIAPHRSLFHEEASLSARQPAVLDDIWLRPGLSKVNLHDTITTFMHSYDGCFVSLLFESSKQRPYLLDGFAITGSKVKVPDYRVQACATLFCLSNQKLLQAREHSLCGSLINEPYSSRASSVGLATHVGSRQYDVEWFRQNFLPDILCVLDSDRATLDLELLGSSPLLSRLGTEAEGLLAELGDSVDEVVEKALVQLAEPEVAGANANNAMPNEWLPGEAEHDDRWPDSMLGPEDDDTSETDGDYMTEADAAAALHISFLGPDSQHHLAPLPPNDHTATGQTNANATHAQDERSNLYSTYLLKSHLRNNLTHDWQARNAHASRHFVGRQSGRALITSSGRNDTSGASNEHAHVAAQAGLILASRQDDTTGNSRDSAAAYPVLAKRKTDDFRTMNGHGVESQPLGGRPVTMHTASHGSMQAKGAQPANQRDNATPDDLAGQRRQSVEPGLVSDRRGQGTRGSISSTNIRVARPALSIRSFFQPTTRLGVPARQPQQVEQRVDDSEVARRVRCGERLKGLFGPWHAHGDDDHIQGELSASLGGNSRRGSVHSLAFSTHVRANLGAKVATAATAATPNAEARGGGFTHRLSRTAAPLVTAAAAIAPAASKGAEHQFGPSQQQRASVACGQHSRQSQHLDASLGHMAAVAPAVAQPPPPPAVPTTVAGSGQEGCTYLYSRASLPNVMMVAVLLDTERGLARRREAERAWDEIVDAVRGTSMYERLMALPG
ncbi:hypothetical protein IWW37_001041 [Coemansia sp. RSA 2050]|nr:hypothetical protein IWW37_001041 [Coemansia sp. RSA 2050]